MLYICSLLWGELSCCKEARQLPSGVSSEVRVLVNDVQVSSNSQIPLMNIGRIIRVRYIPQHTMTLGPVQLPSVNDGLALTMVMFIDLTIYVKHCIVAKKHKKRKYSILIAWLQRPLHCRNYNCLSVLSSLRCSCNCSFADAPYFCLTPVIPLTDN